MIYIAATVKGVFFTSKTVIECDNYIKNDGKLTCTTRNKVVARFRLNKTVYEIFTNSVDAERWLYKQS